jgi:hypothetical protein
VPLHQLGLDLRQASFDRGILVRLEAEEIPCHFRQAIVFEHRFDECRDVLPTGGADDAKLSCIAPTLNISCLSPHSAHSGADFQLGPLAGDRIFARKLFHPRCSERVTID